MTLAPSNDLAVRPAARRRLEAGIEIGLIFALFCLHAAWPVPEVNESHYLPKAKHYWDPAWCARDFFLNAADAHQTFYWTFGWLTRWLGLPAVAWVGRLLSWALLAWAWRRLSVAVLPGFLYSVLTAGLFVAATNRCHMAGEWIIGGVEAKGFAYVFVLLALEAIARNQWRRVWPLLGAASAFHVVVGAWSVLCAGAAWCLAGRERPPLRGLLWPLALGGALSLPGLIPALRLTQGSDPALVREANQIYVFERLPHHLVPQTFPTEFIQRFALLVLLWTVLLATTRTGPAARRVQVFVAATLCITLAGWGISELTADRPAVAAGLLRFYWFRMSDILVPLGVALLAGLYVADRRLHAPAVGRAWLLLALAGVAWHLGLVIERRQANPRSPAENNLADPASWRQTCEWVAANTPPDALFLTPRTAQTFRWHTGRAEVVNRKDIPQDAESIVGWWRRMEDLYRHRLDATHRGWYRSLADLGSQRLLRLGQKYGAEYVITEAQPPLALEQVSPPNEFYAVYRLRPSP